MCTGMWRIESVTGFVKTWKVVDACRTIIIFVVTSQKRSRPSSLASSSPPPWSAKRERSRPSFPQLRTECPQKILRPPRGFTQCIRIRSEEGLSQKVGARSLSFPWTLPFKISLRRALRLHPDKGGDPELFKEVTHACVDFHPFRSFSCKLIHD